VGQPTHHDSGTHEQRQPDPLRLVADDQGIQSGAIEVKGSQCAKKGGRHPSPETRQQRDDQDRRVEQQKGVGKTYLNLETALSRNRSAHSDKRKSISARLRSQPPGGDRNRSRSIGRTHGQPSIQWDFPWTLLWR